MADSLVVDTNVIIRAAGGVGENEVVIRCFSIVSDIIEKDSYKIAIDNEGGILEEYKQNLKQHNTPHAKVMREYINKMVYQNPENRGIVKCIPIREREINELIDMGFDDDDTMFVRVAPNTDMKLIITVDGRSFLMNI